MQLERTRRSVHPHIIIIVVPRRTLQGTVHPLPVKTTTVGVVENARTARTTILEIPAVNVALLVEEDSGTVGVPDGLEGSGGSERDERGRSSQCAGDGGVELENVLEKGKVVRETAPFGVHADELAKGRRIELRERFDDIGQTLHRIRRMGIQRERGWRCECKTE